jgi:Holliday junction resolvase-like predicted endonuclease
MLQLLEIFWTGAKSLKHLDSKVGKFLNPFENITEAAYKIADNADNLSGLARLTSSARTGFGGFYRDLKGINMALSEARLEGGFVENSVYDKLYDNFYERNGRAPSDEEQKTLLNTAKEAGLQALLWNSALIFGSNKITIPNIVGPKGAFAGGLKSKIDDVMQLKGGKVVFEKVKDASAKISKGEFKFVEDSFMNTVKAFKKEPIRKALLGAAGYMKANITEGLQENSQEVIAAAFENYYIHNSLKNQGVGAHQYNKGLNAYLMEEAYGQLSGQGFETFASGFFMGMFGSGFNAAHRSLQWGYNKTFNKEEATKYAELRNTYGKGISDKLNALYSDPKSFFNSREFNYGVQYDVSGNKEDLSEKQVKDQDNEAFISQVYTALDTNTMNYFTDQLSSMKNLSAEEFEEAFGFEKGTGAEYQGRIDNIIDKAKDIEKSYKEINERFPSPVDLTKIGKDHPDYEAAALLDSAWNMAKRQAIFSNETFKDVTKRMSSIYDTIASEPSLAKMSARDLQNLAEMPKMNDELGLLKDEIEMLEQSASKDPKMKADLAFKKKKAAALEGYLNKFVQFNNYYERAQYRGPARTVIAEELGIDESDVTDQQIDDRLNKEIGEMTDERSIKIDSELESAYKDYLRTIADFNGTELFTRDIDKAFIKLKDYYSLKRESRELAKHINLFSDPQGYFDMVKRNTEWMSNVYNNRKKYFDNMVEAQLKAKEHNDLLNALANANIYVDLEEFQGFIENGVYPTKFYDGSGKVITQNHPKYRQVIEMFNLLVEMQNARSGLADQGLDAELQAKIDELNNKMQAEIDNLAKYEQRVNKETLTPQKDKPLRLAEIAQNMLDNSYVELQYGEQDYITFYKDENGTVRFDDKDGEEVDLKADTTKYLQGVTYTMEMQPDPAEVEKIKDKYAELINKLYEEYASKKESAQTEFTAITQDTPLNEMPDELINSLRAAFQSEVLNVMDEETQASLTEDQVMKMFSDFTSTTDTALKIIDEYNVKARAEFATRRLGEKDDFTFRFNNKDIDTKDLTIPQLRSYVTTFVGYRTELENKPNLSQDESTMLNKYKVVINDLEALIRTRSMKQMSPELQKAKSLLDRLLAEQGRIELTPEGYLIDGIVHQRVTTAIQGLKSAPYSYADEQTIRAEFYKAFTNQDVNENTINAYIQTLRNHVPKLRGFSEFTFKELESEFKDIAKDKAKTNEELLESVLKIVREKTFEASRISGNYVDEQIKRLFNNETIVFNEDNITREGFDNLFSEDIDDKTGLPKGYLAQIKARVDTGELFILSQGLRVFDTELKIAGEIDLIVADQNGNISIVDVKTGSKDKWDKWKGSTSYNQRKANGEDTKFADQKAEDYELQQTAYSNLLYRMIGVDAKVGILPVEVSLDPETGKILTANKPTSSALKPGKLTIGLDKSVVQDKVDSIIPRTFTGEAEDAPTISVGSELSPNTRAKLNRLGISNGMISLMSREEIEEAKSYFSKEEAQGIIDKYKDLAMDPIVSDDVIQPESPTYVVNEKNVSNIMKRIDILTKRRDSLGEDIYVVTNTLNYLQTILDTSVEYSQATIQDILNKISELEKVVKSNSIKKTKRGQNTALLIEKMKKQITSEFRLSNDIMNRVRELQYEFEQLDAIKKDLNNQINYYYNLLSDPTMKTFNKEEIQEKIRKVEKKLSTIEKLLSAIRTAIQKSLAYINEYLKLWKTADANYTQFQSQTGYKPLSREQINDLINSSDPEKLSELASYPEMTRQFEALQNDVLEAMDNVDLIEQVKTEEVKRQEELIKALNKYNDQLRYLNDLLTPMNETIVSEPMSDGTTTAAKPANSIVQVDKINERIEQNSAQLSKEEQDGVTVSSLSFGYSVDVVRSNLDNVQTIDELNRYRAELNGQVTLGNIPSNVIPQIATMVKDKMAQLESQTSLEISALSIQKDGQLIAKSDIFTNNLLFAPAGSILTVVKIDNTRKIAKLKYGNKSQDLTFDEIENYTTTMSAVNNQVEPGLEPLPQEDKDKVVISNDLAESFIKDADAVDQAVNEAKGVDNIQDLEDSLLNNLEC